MVFRVSRLNNRTGSVKLFKVSNISYLRVLFLSSLLTFWYINHEKVKGKEYSHVTILFTKHLNILL